MPLLSAALGWSSGLSSSFAPCWDTCRWFYVIFKLRCDVGIVAEYKVSCFDIPGKESAFSKTAKRSAGDDRPMVCHIHPSLAFKWFSSTYGGQIKILCLFPTAFRCNTVVVQYWFSFSLSFSIWLLHLLVLSSSSTNLRSLMVRSTESMEAGPCYR